MSNVGTVRGSGSFWSDMRICLELQVARFNYLFSQVPHLLLTKAPKVEGAALSEKKTHKRKVSGGEDLLKGFLHVHESCQTYGATPRRYMAFLHTYKAIYSAKKGGVEERQRHLQVYIICTAALRFCCIN